MTIIEAIHDFMLDCPLLSGKTININYLGPQPVCYTIDNANEPILIKSYCDGARLLDFRFIFALRDSFDGDVQKNLEISAFFEELEAWLLKQSDENNLPELPDGMSPVRFEVIKHGYLYDTAISSARFQNELRLIYYKEP